MSIFTLEAAGLLEKPPTQEQLEDALSDEDVAFLQVWWGGLGTGTLTPKGKGESKGVTMSTKTLTFDFEVKALNDREIEGHGSVFDNVDLGGDIVARGAFKASLAKAEKNGDMPQMYWMHDPTRVPGVWTKMVEDEKGLYVRGTLADTELGREMRVLAGMKAVRGLSIGYVPTEVEFTKDARVLKAIELWEVSLVSRAMNPLASIVGSKSRISAAGEYVPTERELEAWFRAMGCSKSSSRELVSVYLKSSHGGMPPARWDAEENEEVKDALDKLLAKMRGDDSKR
jgi:hypothetical protein